MTSKVINMVDRMKDKDERALQKLFESDPIADNGFSRRVLRRVRRRIWVRRLTMPTAFVVGAAVAARPAAELLTSLYGLADALPVDLVTVSAESIPQMSTFIVGAVAVAAVLLLLPALED